MSRFRVVGAVLLALAGLTLSGVPSSAALPEEDLPVHAVDDRAVDGPFNVHNNESWQFPVIYNDYLGNRPTSITIQEPPSHGTATIDQDGLLTYSPHEGYLGLDQLTYRLTDSYGAGGPDTETATVYINVFDDTPVHTTRSITLGIGESVALDLGNRPPIFRDCPANSPCGTSVTDAPHLGTATVVGVNEISYLADATPGTETFTTTFTDADGDTATAVVTVVISPPPPPPPGVGDDELTVKGRRFGTVALLSDDEQGDGVTVTGCPTSPHAEITCDGWSMDYVHRDWWSGTEVLDYQRSDAITEHVTVTVTPRLVKHFFDFRPIAGDTYVAGDSEPFEFSLETDEGEMPPGEVMQVQTRRKGTTAWTTVKQLPVKGGTQKFRLDIPTVHHELRLRHPGSDWLAAFSSKVTPVTVGPRLVARLSETAGPGGQPITLAGSIGPVVQGQELLLQRFSPAAGRYVTLQTKTLSSATASIDPGRAFSFRVTPNTTGTTHYQVTAAAVPGRIAVTRSALNYRAK